MELVCYVPCERFEAKQITVSNLWRQLFLDGKLTVAKAEELEFEEQSSEGENHERRVANDETAEKPSIIERGPRDFAQGAAPPFKPPPLRLPIIPSVFVP